MAEFQSYYWMLDRLSASDVACARAVSVDADIEQASMAFVSLLASDDVAARGVALDQYAHCEARGRFGSANPFSRFAPQVVAEARAQLRGDPVLSVTPLGTTVLGANHASALGLLAACGDPSDLDDIARVLSTSVDLNVLEAACLAVDHCLEGAPEGAARRAGEQLSALIRHPGTRDEVRVMALAPFLNHEAADQVAMLREMTTHGSLEVAIHAAWALVGRLDDDTEVRRVVASWPDDAPYPASEVRALLGSA